MQPTIRAIIFLALPLLLVSRLQAQPLSIGQKLPPWQGNNAINAPGGHIDLSQWAGRDVLLVFWNLQCKSTVRDIDSLALLQEAFEGRLKIFLINPEPLGETSRFLKQRFGSIPKDITFISNGSLLKSYFPHFLVPHHVWIGKEGIVRYISHGSYTTRKNIEKFISGADLALPLKKDIHRDETRPMVAQLDSASLRTVSFYSSLFLAIENRQSGVSFHRVGGSKTNNRITVNGLSFRALLGIAFSEGGLYNYRVTGKVVLEDGLDTTSLERDHFAFELQVPANVAPKMYKLMQEQLLQIAGVEVIKEKRPLPCLVLRRKPTSSAPRFSNLPDGTDTKKVDGKKIWYFRNYPVQEFAADIDIALVSMGEQLPLILKFDYDGVVNADLDARLFDRYDFSLFQYDLRKAGWELSREVQMIDALIVKKANSN